MTVRFPSNLRPTIGSGRFAAALFAAQVRTHFLAHMSSCLLIAIGVCLSIFLLPSFPLSFSASLGDRDGMLDLVREEKRMVPGLCFLLTNPYEFRHPSNHLLVESWEKCVLQFLAQTSRSSLHGHSQKRQRDMAHQGIARRVSMLGG